MNLPLALRLGLRELRADIVQGFSGFRIFIACLALGVAVIGGLDGTAKSFEGGLRANAARLLGGDVQLSLPQRDVPEAAQGWLRAHGTASHSESLRAMLRRADGKRSMLVSLRAVDQAYPLYGTVELDPPMPLTQALAIQDGVPGMAVDRRIAERLGVKLGDTIDFGTGKAVLRAMIAALPDSEGSLDLGPPTLVALPALAQAGFDKPGTLATYRWRLKLRAGTLPGTVIAEADAAFPGIGWRATDAAHSMPWLGALVDRLTSLLTLVGLAALMIGGLGVAQAIAAHLERRAPAIAIMKALGATSAVIRSIYLAEIMALAGVGVVIGLVLAAALPWVLASVIGPLLPVPLIARIQPLTLIFAGLCGILSAGAVTLWSLAGEFRLRGARQAPPRWQRLAALWPALLLTLLILAASPARLLTLEAAAGILAAMALFLLLAAALRVAARMLARPGIASFGLRLALGNIHRTKSSARPVMLGLGLGTAVLIAISQIEGNFERLTRDLQSDATPSLFMIDIQTDQLGQMKSIVAATPGIGNLQTVPMLRTHVVAVNGQPIASLRLDANTHRLVDGDRGLTYSAEPPPGSRIVAGRWWPADYRGPPLVSMDESLAKGLHLALGQTITINIAGRDITARLANLRHIDWSSLGINFFMVMAPGTLEPVPQTHLATLRAADPGAQDRLEEAIGDKLPNVSIVEVGDTLTKVTAVVRALATGLSAVGAILIGAGLLVLAGAAAATERRRSYDAVILKSLGATRGDLVRSYMLEYGILGVSAALVAAALGYAGARFAVSHILDLGWTAEPVTIVGIAVAAVAVTMVLGYAGTWRMLGRATLRHLNQ